MSEDRLTYEELKARHDDLQKQAARSLIIDQELIIAKDHLDRDLARFRTIQTYGQKVIHARSLEEFSQITVESIIETFEIECSALLTYDKTRSSLKVEAAFGFEELEVGYSLKTDWVGAKGHLKGKNAFIENMDADTHPWAFLGLCQMILCPYENSKGDLRGFVLGGRSQENQAYYDEITREIIPSFMVFSQQMSTLLQNLESKEHLDRTVQKRTKELKAANVELIKINEDLEQEITARKSTEEKLRLAEQEAKELSEFLKKMFGRYISTKVMNSLLENPSALELGGERRNVTIMMSDLRGFTAITERLEPEQVVKMLNSYFEVMVEVIHQYSGTINEIIGDSLLIIFGAPQEIPERAQQAIACSIAMQNAMGKVNEKNRLTGLPELEMGIGLHDSEVIVGNIGSSKRIKYSVVGSGVNLVSRIESYTVGGQILVSESVHQEAGDILRIDGQREVLPKGSEVPLRLYEIGGIAGNYNLALEGKDSDLVALTQKVPLRYTILEGKHIGKKDLEGFVVRLSKKVAEIVLDEPVEQFSNLKMNLKDVYEELAVKDFYGKVTDQSGKDGYSYMIRFTSVPLEVVSYFLAHQKYATIQLDGENK
jgi:class 3 adenylate cyclase